MPRPSIDPSSQTGRYLAVSQSDVWRSSLSQDFGIETARKPTIRVATTGISETERKLFPPNPRLVLQDRLTATTQILVTYKAVMTKKYIQALKLRIPIVSPLFLYDPELDHRKYQLKPLSGARFSTSGIADEMYSNYLILLGAQYEPNCSIFIDFLVADDRMTEKSTFCTSHDIPIISTSEVFKNNFDLFLKPSRYDALHTAVSKVFSGKTFLLDSELPRPIFNKLRRLIIENDGTRVSSPSGVSKVNFILSSSTEKYREYRDLLLHYQYVFDCVEYRAVLFPDFYRMWPAGKCEVMSNVIAAVDSELGPSASEYENKLVALGATVKRDKLDARITHFVTRRMEKRSECAKKSRLRGGRGSASCPVLNKKARIAEHCAVVVAEGTGSLSRMCSESAHNAQRGVRSYLSVLPEWVDHVLVSMRFSDPGRFLVDAPVLSLKKRISLGQRSVASAEHPSLLVQFTSLPAFLKDLAVKKLEEANVEYVDSGSFENCTHLIMGQPSISEKFLCTLVSGGWILRADCIDHIGEGALEESEKYEWTLSDDVLEKDRKLVKSIRRWRERIRSSGRPPFVNWRVKLYASGQKYKSYVAIIAAGGGQVTDKDDFTHVFVEKGYSGEVVEKKTHSMDQILSYLFRT